LSTLLEQPTAEDAMKQLAVGVSDYWQTHYSFGKPSRRSEKRLGRKSLESLVINGVVPVMFAAGRHRQKDQLTDKALEWLEQLPVEDNHIVRLWQKCGLKVESAQDSQALIQLRKRYCDRRDCLRCRFGYEYLQQKQRHE
jgi:hypothetical protein